MTRPPPPVGRHGTIKVAKDGDQGVADADSVISIA
jgi:hypothetical protein